ncbi:MAG: FecR family protein [Pseudomonas sp.]|uniref:FecR family protein n=1 Tax=Pseudomonas abieticivorans TaxID=2931382 RepID=UPI0020C0741B|nr:FecR family protein [Pseudomonas sp. PIA16]MDE1169292.1 FecR family protein [Pseudomonas sp.]
MLSPPASDPSNDRVSDEAANWCMRVNEPDFTEQERDQLHRWLSSDPAHQREYDAMLEIWTISEFLPADAPAHIAPAPAPRRTYKRPLMAAAALVLALPLAGLLGWQLNLIPDSYQRFESGSSVRDITLADGSHVQMNLGSQLSFANFKDRRSVTLGKGEAYFEVQHDASHPFLVNAGKGQVRVTGTHFNVWTYEDQVVVTLTQGSVQVMGNRNQPDQLAYLSPGMQARYDARSLVPDVSAASANEVLAWRDGKLILDDIPLSEALPQINRYLDKPIHLGDRATNQLRIGGIYNTRNISGLVQALPKVLPVYLSRNDEGETVISSKPRYVK